MLEEDQRESFANLVRREVDMNYYTPTPPPPRPSNRLHSLVYIFHFSKTSGQKCGYWTYNLNATPEVNG